MASMNVVSEMIREPSSTTAQPKKDVANLQRPLLIEAEETTIRGRISDYHHRQKPQA